MCFVAALGHVFLWFIFNLRVLREVKGQGARSKMATNLDNPQQNNTMQTDPDVVNGYRNLQHSNRSIYLCCAAEEVSMQCLCFPVFPSRGSVVDGYRERGCGRAGGRRGRKGFTVRDFISILV